MNESIGAAVVPGPREVFARMRERWLSNEGPGLTGDLLAGDAVIEEPFAPPGRARRHQGRDEFLAFARDGRAKLPARFEECREIAVHETIDPEVIVVEYELSGLVTTTGQRASSTFIGVLRVRDGRIVLWREYQNVLAIAQALGQLPELLASAGAAGSPAGAGQGSGSRPAPGVISPVS